MSVVKLPMIHAQACSKILDLAIFSSQEALSLHFGLSSSGRTFPLGKGTALAGEVLQVGLEV